MKKLLPLLLLLTGCAIFSGSNFQTVAGKFLTSTALTVDTTMQAAAKLEVQGIISTNDWAVIAADYNQYRTAMIIATNAYTLAVAAGNPSLFAPASNTLFTSQNNLTTKVTSITPK